MAIGGLGHRGIAAACAEAREVERPGVEAARIPVVEPGTAAEIEADGQCRGKGGAVDVEHRRAASQGPAGDEHRPRPTPFPGPTTLPAPPPPALPPIPSPP